MKNKIGLVLAFITFVSVAQAAKIGKPAPAFTGTDIGGKPVRLSDFKGKYVVLEWHNKNCPYVKAQYDAGNLQRLQKEWTGKGIVWISVVSSAKGKEGYVDAAGAKKDLKDTGAAPSTMILDENGKIGHAYDAKTTPHMFVIDPTGTLIYNGALDDHPANDKADVLPTSTNYVELALNESLSKKKFSHPTSKPYGCSVKY